MIPLSTLRRTPLRAVVGERDREVARYDQVLSGSPTLRALVEEAAHIADVPAAVVNLLKASSQRTLAAIGTEVTVLDRRDTLCGAIVEAGLRVHVPDVSQDERWAHNPFVDGRWARLRFYGAHPLISPAGVSVGTLCVLDGRPRELAPEQVVALDALADRVVDELERLRLAALQKGVRRLASWDAPAAG